MIVNKTVVTKDFFKNSGEWDIVKKGGRGSQQDPKILKMFNWDIHVGRRGHDGHVPNTARIILFKRKFLIINVLINVVARLLVPLFGTY